MDENIKSSYYSILPAVVRYDKDLTDKAKLLYSEITCLCNKEGYCFATNNYFANLYNCTPRAIQFTISKLQEKGYIKIIVENNYQRKIYLTDALGYEIYSNLKRLEFIYPKKIINTMEQANLIKLKEIIYTLFLIYNSNFKSIMCKFDREILVNLYLTCKDYNTDDFFNYYRQAIINKYIDTS